MINDKLEYLHRAISGVIFYGPMNMGIFERMYSLGIVSMFNEVNRELEELNNQLDSEINLQAVSIKFDVFLDKDYWKQYSIYKVYEELEKLDDNKDNYVFSTEINTMTDYLPNGVKGYNVTPDVLSSFKTAMHQLCDEDRMSFKDLFYGLNLGLDKMLDLLQQIKKKVLNPKIHLYKKFWEETLEEFYDEEYDSDYADWLDDIGEPTFEDLKARQKQEIFNFLNKNFLRYCKTPTGAEVKNRKLVVKSDDLEYGTQIPESMGIECAKLEKFITWKDEHIMVLNYEKLGQYIYKYYRQFEEIEFFYITNFDRIMDDIHEAMARLKPNLAKHLKRYEENMIYELSTDCKKIMNTCKRFLKDGIRETFLDEYIDTIMYDPAVKEETRTRLGGQSKPKLICELIAHLNNFYVFDAKYNADDFSEALKKEINSVSQDTLRRYIRDSINSRNGALYTWTKNNIERLMRRKTE